MDQTPERSAATPASPAEILNWRKGERRRLIDARLQFSQSDRQARAAEITRKLDLAIGDVSGRRIGVYWPFQGEPDLRPWANTLIARSAQLALPVVVQKGAPLEYRSWAPGEPLERGIWNILVPARRVVVLPDIMIAPVVGFDAQNYRLGYGGGFFDRTMASMTTKPKLIGVGYAECEIPTIHPLPHDIPMEFVVVSNSAGDP